MCNISQMFCIVMFIITALYHHSHVISNVLICSYSCYGYSGSSKNHKEAFMSGDLEPWVFRGGLTAEFQVKTIIHNRVRNMWNPYMSAKGKSSDYLRWCWKALIHPI